MVRLLVCEAGDAIVLLEHAHACLHRLIGDGTNVV